MSGHFVVETAATPVLFAAQSRPIRRSRRPPYADDRRLRPRRPLRALRRDDPDGRFQQRRRSRPLHSVLQSQRRARADLILSRGIRSTAVARNISPEINRQTLTIEVVDAAGRRNEFGRVVRVRPDHVPGVTLTRVVDGGSAMLAQGPYPLTIPTPYPGPHRVDVRFAGAKVRVYASGRIEPF